jgi:hypothetical protein
MAGHGPAATIAAVERHAHHGGERGATPLASGVVQGVQACNLGMPILAKELANRSKKS